MGPPRARRRPRRPVPHRAAQEARGLARLSAPRSVFTVGHSTQELDDFVGLLRGAGVRGVADVRRFPGSRRLPWFNAEALAESLPAAGIGYAHLPGLGGRRSRRPDSSNGGWENASFQGYADWMAGDVARTTSASEVGPGETFAEGLARLEALARASPIAFMCAEAPWWRCHRRLVADALLVRGWAVTHILPGGRLAAHELTDFAVAGDDGTLTYPPAQLSL